MQKHIDTFETYINSISPTDWCEISSIDHLNGSTLAHPKRNNKKHIQKNVASLVALALDDFMSTRDDSKKLSKRFSDSYTTIAGDILKDFSGTKFDGSFCKKLASLFDKHMPLEEIERPWLSKLFSKKEQDELEQFDMFISDFIPYSFEMVEKKNWHPIPTIAFINSHLTENNRHTHLTRHLSYLYSMIFLLKSGYEFIIDTPLPCQDYHHPRVFIGHIKNCADTFLARQEKVMNSDNLSDRQQQIFKTFKGKSKVTPRFIELETEISRPTINQALRKLEQIGKIKRIGQGRSTQYMKC